MTIHPPIAGVDTEPQVNTPYYTAYYGHENGPPWQITAPLHRTT